MNNIPDSSLHAMFLSFSVSLSAEKDDSKRKSWSNDSNDSNDSRSGSREEDEDGSTSTFSTSSFTSGEEGYHLEHANSNSSLWLTSQGFVNAIHGMGRLGITWDTLPLSLQAQIDNRSVQMMSSETVRDVEASSFLQSMAVMKADWGDFSPSLQQTGELYNM